MKIETSPSEQAAYEALAAAEGLSVEQWLKKPANEHVYSQAARSDDLKARTLSELLAPVRGLLTDEEIDRCFARNRLPSRPLDLR